MQHGRALLTDGFLRVDVVLMCFRINRRPTTVKQLSSLLPVEVQHSSFVLEELNKGGVSKVFPHFQLLQTQKQTFRVITKLSSGFLVLVGLSLPP